LISMLGITLLSLVFLNENDMIIEPSRNILITDTLNISDRVINKPFEVRLNLDSNAVSSCRHCSKHCGSGPEEWIEH